VRGVLIIMIQRPSDSDDPAALGQVWCPDYASPWRTWHCACIFALLIDAGLPTGKMQSETLETAKVRYTAAYEAYQQATRSVAEKLKNRLVPSMEDISEEAKAIEALAVARRTLIDAISNAVLRH
jgi:hypothetical protein